MSQQGIGFMLSNPISVMLIYCPSFGVYVFKNNVAARLFVSLNRDRTSRPNKASSRWLFMRYYNAL